MTQTLLRIVTLIDSNNYSNQCLSPPKVDLSTG